MVKTPLGLRNLGFSTLHSYRNNIRTSSLSRNHFVFPGHCICLIWNQKNKIMHSIIIISLLTVLVSWEVTRDFPVPVRLRACSQLYQHPSWKWAKANIQSPWKVLLWQDKQGLCNRILRTRFTNGLHQHNLQDLLYYCFITVGIY